MVARSLVLAAQPGMAEAQIAFAHGMKRLRADTGFRLTYEMQVAR